MNGLVAEKIGESGVDIGVAEGLVHQHLAVEGQRHLARGEEAVVHVATGPREQGVDGASVEGGHGAGR